jgi:peroxidase
MKNNYMGLYTIMCVFLFVSVAIISISGYDIDTDDLPTPVDGLSWTFYNETCPNLESIVNATLEQALDDDITQAAGLLRLHFHDCFVQGCDGSVLLTGTTTDPGEQDAPPNLTLRARAFQLINELKAAVEANCSGVVSCADILTLAARDSVAKAGGPDYPVPLGRRDSLDYANQSVVLSNLPSPDSNLSTLTASLGNKGLNLTDLVALSGGHTIGIGHCSSFDKRLYNTSTGITIVDPTLDVSFASTLYSICPVVNDTVNSTNLDLITPNVFDNNYYLNLQNNETLFTSDQTLYSNSADTEDIVDSFASNQTVFFENFILGMLKMGQLDVLTGSEGEIRTNCSIANTDSSYYQQIIESIVGPEEQSQSSQST